MAILDEIPLGRFNIEMGLELRQAMLINGILYNSEAWQSISDDEFKQLELIDNHILRKILGAHSKTSTSFLHLETGTIPIRFVIANRRLVFYYNIMSKPGSELIKRVFNAQKDNPTKGDWYHTIKSEFELIMEDIGDYDEQTIKSMKFSSYKKFIKKKIREAAFKFLQSDKSSKSKVKDIEYKKLAPQKYIKSNQFTNDEVQLLARLRSRNTSVKDNFSRMHEE